MVMWEMVQVCSGLEGDSASSNRGLERIKTIGVST